MVLQRAEFLLRHPSGRKVLAGDEQAQPLGRKRFRVGALEDFRGENRLAVDQRDDFIAGQFLRSRGTVPGKRGPLDPLFRRGRSPCSPPRHSPQSSDVARPPALLMPLGCLSAVASVDAVLACRPSFRGGGGPKTGSSVFAGIEQIAARHRQDGNHEQDEAGLDEVQRSKVQDPKANKGRNRPTLDFGPWTLDRWCMNGISKRALESRRPESSERPFCAIRSAKVAPWNATSLQNVRSRQRERGKGGGL